MEVHNPGSLDTFMVLAVARGVPLPSGVLVF